jgi:hypothetical protein
VVSGVRGDRWRELDYHERDGNDCDQAGNAQELMEVEHDGSFPKLRSASSRRRACG